MDPLWQPRDTDIAKTQMTAFGQKVAREHGLAVTDYASLHQWSIEHPEEFWAAVWDYCDILASEPYESVVSNFDQFPGAEWFPGSCLNFAQNLMRFRDDQIALVGLLENGDRRAFTYAEIWSEVEKLASAMRRLGLVAGDRVAGYLPNIPETVIAMLATTSIGAIWSSCSPDFGVRAACDRLGQIRPRVLFTASAYLYNGKTFDCLGKARETESSIGSLEATIVVPMLASNVDLSGWPKAVLYEDFVREGDVQPLTFEPLPFDHPVYILYSSGTTGMPKCIVHGAGGALIQHLKEHRLHVNLTREDTLFYFTTCGWMMWNWLVSGLATGATLVLYDGSPFAADQHVLLNAIDDEGITVFGTSAKYIAALENFGVRPAESHRLATLRTIISTGSPLSHASFRYVYRDFKKDVQLASISGGTDIHSCFVLGNPNLPVYAGEIQCRALGMAVEFWHGDTPAKPGERGDLVCTQAFPSTPIGFWNDADGSKFRSAYFAQRPGVWTHGDYGEITAAGGIIIHGRSDAILNPAGVRIGTAEIYRQVETVAEVADSVAVGQQWQDDERIVLFVVLNQGYTLNEALVAKIKSTIRQNATARHVPAKIIAVPDIPRTVSGKTVELAVRKIIHGGDVDNREALANPQALDHFRGIAALEG